MLEEDRQISLEKEFQNIGDLTKKAFSQVAAYGGISEIVSQKITLVVR